MHKLKKILKNLLYTVYGFASGVYTPGFMSLAFNFMKGVGNNPEGTVFIPFGVAILLAILTIDILIIGKTIKSHNLKKYEKVLTVSLFVVIKLIGLMVDQNGWRNFIHCFKWKFMQ